METQQRRRLFVEAYAITSSTNDLVASDVIKRGIELWNALEEQVPLFGPEPSVGEPDKFELLVTSGVEEDLIAFGEFVAMHYRDFSQVQGETKDGRMTLTISALKPSSENISENLKKLNQIIHAARNILLDKVWSRISVTPDFTLPEGWSAEVCDGAKSIIILTGTQESQDEPT